MNKRKRAEFGLSCIPILLFGFMVMSGLASSYSINATQLDHCLKTVSQIGTDSFLQNTSSNVISIGIIGHDSTGDNSYMVVR